MGFVEAMDSRSLGENGAPELTAKGVGEPLVALFFKLVRGMPEATLSELVAACTKAGTASGYADLVVLAFQTRATRGMGKGEKDLFYRMLTKLPEEAVLATLPLVPHFGYYKDYLLMMEAEGMSQAIKERALSLMAEALRNDEKELEAAARAERTPNLTLAAKYAPREGCHFDKGLGAAKKLAAALYGGANPAAARRKYRKLVSRLNAALGTTEVLMAAQRWEEIEFGRVASLCLQRQRKAFLNETLKGKLSAAQDETGNRHPDNPARVAARRALRAALLEKGAKGVNGKALQPHEIARKCMGDTWTFRAADMSTVEADLMHAQWESLRQGVVETLAAAAAAREAAAREAAADAAAASGGVGALAAMGTLRAGLPRHVDLGRLVPLVDVSGSMDGTPMEAAIALGILVSELSHPAFRHRALTFESRPNWVDLSGCAKIADKVRCLEKAPWGGSTDFEAACEMILQAAQAARLKPDEVPDLIVFSDMQFNQASGGGRGRWETHHERLTRRFAEVGRAVCGEPYAAPRIIYWNLRGDTAGFPVAADEPNTQLLSGFSPSLLKLVLSGKDIVADEKEVTMPDGTVKLVREGPTPAETVRAALDDEAFDAVRLALAAVEHGPLAAYTFEKDELVIVADEAPAAAEAEAEGFELIAAA